LREPLELDLESLYELCPFAGKYVGANGFPDCLIYALDAFIALGGDRFHRHREEERISFRRLDELGRKAPVLLKALAAPIDSIAIRAEQIRKLPRRQLTSSFKHFDNLRLQNMKIDS
jgi:hypothetical protein